jgi:hypothetical protein
MTATIPEPLAGATPVELHIAKLELKPGDILVLRLDHKLSDETCNWLRDNMRRVLPEGVKAMVLDKDADLSVVRAEDAKGR